MSKRSDKCHHTSQRKVPLISAGSLMALVKLEVELEQQNQSTRELWNLGES